MSRTARNNMKNSSFFHIMVQGINKECIFYNNENKVKYLKLIQKNKESIEIIAYCIMDNHAHFLVKVENICDMKEWMKRTNITYALYYNKVNNRVGYVFRNRYKSQIIENEKHFFTCVDYIHENPVKAFMCKKKEDYKYSSYTNMYNGNQTNVNNQINRILSESMLYINGTKDEKEDRFKFIEDEKEDKEEVCKDIISRYLQFKQASMEELKGNREMLTEVVRVLSSNGISLRVMEKYLIYSREGLRKLIK